MNEKQTIGRAKPGFVAREPPAGSPGTETTPLSALGPAGCAGRPDRNRRPSHRAKQSQLASYRRETALTTLGESVRNEANWLRTSPKRHCHRRGQTCETKPIRPERQERTWTGAAAGGAVAGTAGTNEANLPAWTEMGAGGRRRPRRRRRGSLRQTNPIGPAPAGRDPGCRGHKPCRPWAPARQTKPISRRRAGKGPGRQGRSCRHGRAETCETKPIVAEVAWTASAL